MTELLSIKMKPNTLDDIAGQTHLVGPNKILSNLVKNKKLFSIILYGKPGIGKTSIANALVNDLGLRYRSLNTTINNKKDFDTVIEEAKLYKGLILIMDEIHRLNKDKQDLLLPNIESGLITLIGMTTANPYHSLNPALRSRCHLLELKELSDDDINNGIKKASLLLDNIIIDDETINYIVKLSSGDLRYAYNILELAYHSLDDDKQIDIEIIKKINTKPVFMHDKNSENYYDVLSAFQKSIRGSDVNASLHYLARLIVAEDLDSILRRMSVIAYEDIGLANPSIVPKIEACINICERLGLPEARIPLSVMIIEMALSPKSNSAYLALDKAIQDIENGNVGSVPDNIKPHSKEYLYPHVYPNSYVKQQYLPDKLKTRKYYKPKNNKYENNLKQILESLEKE